MVSDPALARVVGVRRDGRARFRLTSSREIVGSDRDGVVLEVELKRSVDQRVCGVGEGFDSRLEQLALLIGAALRDENHEASVKGLIAVEAAEVLGVVGDEGEVAVDDAGHQIPIGRSAQPQPDYVAGLMPQTVRDLHERGVQALVEQEVHRSVVVGVLRLILRTDVGA